MKKNMSAIDRVVRVIIAVIFIALYATGIIAGTAGLILIALAGVFLGTSVIGSCPLYLPFGLNTLKRRSTHKG